MPYDNDRRSGYFRGISLTNAITLCVLFAGMVGSFVRTESAVAHLQEKVQELKNEHKEDLNAADEKRTALWRALQNKQDK